MGPTEPFNPAGAAGLRVLSKFTCFSTLFLIFAGGMVTSTGSGLAVPDWPLSYGMLFPPMVGGVFYEHGHRMVAEFVGLLTLILAVWTGVSEKRNWVRKLTFWALGAVIAQGILGGITVKFFLPPAVSICHGILAQTFFIMTILLAYSHSQERSRRSRQTDGVIPENENLKMVVLLTMAVYLQLIIGAVMRHTKSGLAIPDFPTMGGTLIPRFDGAMLAKINDWRFEKGLDPVNFVQVSLHFLHRLWAFIILVLAGLLGYRMASVKLTQEARASVFWLLQVLWLQVILGVLTVLSAKSSVITSLHVVTGAATLGACVLLLLRVAPLSWERFWRGLK